MSNLVGSVHFRATIDGKKMPDDAKRIGQRAGEAGVTGFNDEWDKEFRRGLSREGQLSLDHWKRYGKRDGLAYGRGLELEFKKFSSSLSNAFDNFQGIQVKEGFLDEAIGNVHDFERASADMRSQLELLNRQGSITDSQFRRASETLEKWTRTQRESAIQARLAEASQARQSESMRALRTELDQHARARENLLRVERDHARTIETTNRDWVDSYRLVDRLTLGVDKNGESVSRASAKWSDLSHNTRQWTLIIGAVTAAIPELAGLSSAAGSGLFTLAGGATAAGVGLGTTISAIVGLNKDIEKLPASLHPAKRAFDDFKKSFSDLNEVITGSAFGESETAWRSLASTVRGLSPAFEVVGKSVGRLTSELANGLAPGTKNFRNLSGLIESSAPLFEDLVKHAGRLGEGLLDAFNNPSMQRSMKEMVGWIGELSDGFADFLEGDSFDVWLRHGREVFGAFGDLLSTTGRLLNDLVTDASIKRLTTFMDNIGTFLDTGGRGILEFADELNAFGVIADLLATVGEALEPLREPMAELAGVLRDQLSAAFDGLALVLNALATVAAPVATAIGDIFGAIPPEAVTLLSGIAAGTLALYGGLRAIQGVQGVVAVLQGVSTEGEKATTKLGKLGRGAGIAAGSMVALVAVGQAITDALNDAFDFDDKARNLVASSSSIKDAFTKLSNSGEVLDQDMGDVISRLGDLGNFFVWTGSTFDAVGKNAVQLSNTLKHLDEPITKIANTDMSMAVAQFNAWGSELGASGDQLLTLLSQMPNFKAAVEAAAGGVDGLATDQEVLNYLLKGGRDATSSNTGALTEMGGAAQLTKDQIDSLAQTIRGFGDASLSSRDAERQFEAALDDLTASVAANGTSLDINTEQGRANQAALDDIAKTSRDAAAAKLELTGSEDDAAAAIQRGRDALINQLGQFGITGQAAEDYANDLGLIPADVYTKAVLDTEQATRDLGAWLRRANGSTFVVTGRVNYSQAPGGSPVAFASGGVLAGPKRILAGEAGPEAIVPLNRALNQVDPSVRWLSALAQGKIPAMAGGGVVGGGREVTFEAGSIVVQGAMDPRRTALDVMDEIADAISS